MPKHTSTAKVVDGSLVLSLPDASMPVVMRLDLEEAKSASFSVNKKKEEYFLNVQLSSDDIREIAPYDDREKAVNALMAASVALEKGSHQNSSSGPSSVYSGNSGNMLSVGKWAAAFITLFVLFWIIGQMINMGPRLELVEASTSASSNVATNAQAPSTNPRQTTGVAVSADDFLRQQ